MTGLRRYILKFGDAFPMKSEGWVSLRISPTTAQRWFWRGS